MVSIAYSRFMAAASSGRRRAQKSRPWADLAQAQERLRTVRIVETENGRLRKNIGRPEAAGVLGIALDFGGPTLMAFNEKAGRHAAERHRRGKEQGPSRNDLF